METTRRCSPLLIAGIALACFMAAGPQPALAAPGSGLDQPGVWDAPSRYFPGHYLEQKAQFYLKRKDYREALRLFELSGYWADKVSQYHAGIMHFNGIGVPVDRPRGAAWLGIAAESHDDLAVAALQAAWAELTPDERMRADPIFRTLVPKYGNAVALPRALRQYAFDAKQSLFGFGIPGPGSVQVAAGAAGSSDENSADFVHRMDAQRDALIARITGHVTVGAVRPLEVAPEARHDASDTVLELQAPSQ
jgi:TPR repeat protein